MYRSELGRGFYGIREDPFAPTPDPRYLFHTSTHARVLADITQAIRERRGFVLISGEVGTGKTTLIRCLLEQFGVDIRSAYLLSSNLDFDEILEATLRDLGIEGPARGRAERIEALNRVLLAEAEAGRLVVLAIDEAQGLSASTLEQLRMLSNLETARHKLLQIMLVGQPELMQRLQTPKLSQLRQRIAVVAQLRPLTRSETARYILHRLAVAGAGGQSIFTARAIRRIHRVTRGIPRLINLICDKALTRGHAGQSSVIDLSVVKQVTREQGRAWPSQRRFPWRWLAVGVLGAVAITVFVTGWADGVLSDWRLTKTPPPALDQVSTPAVVIGAGAPRAREGGVSDPVHQRRPAEQPEVRTSRPPLRREMVRSGDTLRGLAARVYGRSDLTVLDLIQRANPSITDIDRIVIGTSVGFPPIASMSYVEYKPGAGYRVHVMTDGSRAGAGQWALPATARLAGRQVYVAPVRLAEHLTAWRVLVGDFTSEAEAKLFLHEIDSALPQGS